MRRARARRYVLLKERNALQTERLAARAARMSFLNPYRLHKARVTRLPAASPLPACCCSSGRGTSPRARGGQVRKSMARIKTVLTERALQEAETAAEAAVLMEKEGMDAASEHAVAAAKLRARKEFINGL